MKEDKSKPNPDWVDAPYEAVGIEFNKATGKWEKFIWKDLKYQRIPEGEVDDEEDDDDE